MIYLSPSYHDRNGCVYAQAPLNERESLNVTTHLLFDSAATLASQTLRRALEREHPLVALPANRLTRRASAPLVLGHGASIVAHPHAQLLGIGVRWKNTSSGHTPMANRGTSSFSLVLRWMNTAESGKTVDVPLTQLVQALTGVEASRVQCKELTLTTVARRADAASRRLRWDQDVASVRIEQERSCSGVVEPLDMRTYEFTWVT